MEGKSCSKLEEPEISPITVKNGCDKVGGYDCDFVESPADDLLCKICHYPARDPILAVCCGQSFCSCCLECYRQSKVIDHSSCPYCREENFQTVPDKRTGRCVLNLKVFCPHKHQGCEWIGELRSLEDHMNKKSNNNIDSEDNLTAKMQSIKEELQITEKDLQDTKDKLKETRSQLAEKGRELDEVRKNTEENNKILRGMIQQLTDKLEGTEQLLQQQVKINAFQIKTIFKFTWSTQLNYLARGDNKVVPFISKFDVVETVISHSGSYQTNTVFYTRDRGYKMCLRMCVHTNRIIVTVELMKGDHDDHLTWPVRGTLTVQLLNQISDSNHSEPVEFIFNGSDEWCHRIMKEASFIQSIWNKNKVMPQTTLFYTCDENCRNVMDDCAFFRVCNFQ